MKKLVNKEAYDAVKDMHRGLHIAMEELINRHNHDRAEQILRELDHHMKRWLNDTKIAG